MKSILITRLNGTDMKPLTPAQQRVVDVMKKRVFIRLERGCGRFEHCGTHEKINKITARNLIRKGVVIVEDKTATCIYYTLSPEYKN